MKPSSGFYCWGDWARRDPQNIGFRFFQQPARLGNFLVHVVCPVSLTEEQNEGLMRSVHHCLVHNTLLTPPEIKIELAVAETVAAQR